LFAQLSLPLQYWVRQQADQIVRYRRFGLGEEMRLNEAIQQKLKKTPRERLEKMPLGSPPAADVAALTYLKFMVLTEVYRDEMQIAESFGENFDQKMNQLFMIISTVVKSQAEQAEGIIRNLV
jgi:hypothetical protein